MGRCYGLYKEKKLIIQQVCTLAVLTVQKCSGNFCIITVKALNSYEKRTYPLRDRFSP